MNIISKVLVEQVDLLEALEVVNAVWGHSLVIVDRKSVLVVAAHETIWALSGLLHKIVRQNLNDLYSHLSPIRVHFELKRIFLGVELSTEKGIFLGLLGGDELLAGRRSSLTDQIPKRV